MKVIYIIAHTNFRDEEYFAPKKILENKGIGVVTASTELTPAIGKLGGQAEINLTLDQINPADYDAIILAGGHGAINYINDPVINRLLNEFKMQNKLIAAICIAPAILAQAGILKDKKFTLHPEGNDVIFPLVPEKQDVVVDGNLITANGPKAATEFGLAILDKLTK